MLLTYTFIVLIVWLALIWAFDPDGLRKTAARTRAKARRDHGRDSDARTR